jgi:phosphopantothenoylcysteine decarboxylase/phosphopantothenate--cysteine ligase
MISYPANAEVHWVETTEQMLQRCLEIFPHCVGVIGAAAPCDFKPISFSEQKISKTNDGSIAFQFTETPDILAALGMIKRKDQWSVSFALEMEDGEARALSKLRKKRCDFVVLNDPSSINSDETSFQVFDEAGKQLKAFEGSKYDFAKELLRIVAMEKE